MSYAPGDVSMQTSILRELVSIFYYRKKYFYVTFAVFAAAALLIAVLLPPVYVSGVKFNVVMPQHLDPLRKTETTDTKNEYMRILLAQKEIVNSERVIQKTAERLYPGRSPEEYDKIGREMRQKIDVAPPKDATFEFVNVYNLSYANSDPATAYQVIRVLTDTYLQVLAEIAHDTSGYSYEFFKGQVDGLQADLREKAASLKQYETEHALALVDILNIDAGKSAEIGVKSFLTAAVNKRTTMLAEYNSLTDSISSLRADLAKNSIPTVLPDMEGSGKAISTYKETIAKLQMQLAEMGSKFSADHRPYQKLKADLGSAIALLRDELKVLLRSKEVQAKVLENQLQESQKEIARLEGQMQETTQERTVYENLRSDYTLAAKVYAEAREKLEQARQASALSQQRVTVTVIDPPVQPVKPAKPNRRLIVLLGVVLGALAGLTGVLLLDHFDHTIRTPKDVRQFLGTQYLGSIPRARGALS